MSAATVIPAPLARIKVIAVKKLIGLLQRPFTHKGNYLVLEMNSMQQFETLYFLKSSFPIDFCRGVCVSLCFQV